MNKMSTSAVTATGDTTKTLIDTITTPKDAKRIVGVAAYAIGAATLTSGEAVTGILELESDDMSLAPMQIPLDCVTILTSGAIAYSPKVWPLSIDLPAQARIRGYMTMDMAQTGALKGRFSLVYEV